MDKINTRGIVLRRLDYREADRIIRFITADKGKVSVIAKGVRKPKSKLASGIELFNISEVGFIQGKSDLGTLVSCRLDKHFDNIVKDIDRTMLGYQMLKKVDKVTEDHDNEEFYSIIETALDALNDDSIPVELIEIWFGLRVLDAEGRSPNLITNSKGEKLEEKESYIFDFDSMSFIEKTNGEFNASDIKFLRLVTSQRRPQNLTSIVGLNDFLPKALSLSRNIEKYTSL